MLLTAITTSLGVSIVGALKNCTKKLLTLKSLVLVGLKITFARVFSSSGTCATSNMLNFANLSMDRIIYLFNNGALAYASPLI